MLRFLRRYNKSLLVVGGVLLLVAWAIGGTLSQLAGQSALKGRVWATVGGVDVRGEMLQEVQAELQILEAFGANAIPVPGATRDAVHYYLLRREAMDTGLVGTPEDGLRSLTEQFAAARALNPEAIDAETFLARMQTVTGQSRETILRTVAIGNGINRLVALYDGAPRLSDRRMRRAAADLFTAVDADYAVIDGRRLSTSLDWAPTEEQLAAHLAKYGDVVPSPTGGFGYRLPNRLKLEWLVVPADSVKAALESSDELSNIELRKHRDRNLALFPKPVDGSDDFETIREAVKANRMATLLDEQMQAIAKFATDQLQLPLRAAPREGVYVKLPEDWDRTRPSFEALATSIASQFGVALPAWSTSGPEWIEIRDVDRQPGLEGATTDRFGATMMRPSQMVAQLREFGGSDTYGLQAGVAGPPLRRPTGDLVLWRATAVDPSRAPRSVDEVRDRLVADLKAVEQFDRLVKELPGLREQALRDGLLAVASANQTTVQSARDITEANRGAASRGMRLTSPLPGLGNAPEVVKAIVAVANALPADQPVAAQPESERIFALPVPDRLAVVVGRVTGIRPVLAEEFEDLATAGAMSQLVLGEQLARLRDQLFSRPAMEKRLDFKLAKEFAEDDEGIPGTDGGDRSDAGSTPATQPASSR